LWEVDEAANRVRQEVDPEANIIVGATFDAALGERVRVSIVASGMGRAGRLGQNAAANAPPVTAQNRAEGPAAGAAAPDFRWRLSQAIRSKDTVPADAGEEEPAPSGWEAPGGVVISEGPPRLYGREPADRPADGDPAARFPALADFPVPAQRAYRAMQGERAAAAPPLRRPTVYRQPINDSRPSKFGLLRRLAEAARGRRDEFAASPQSATPEAGEEVDLPAFFGRGKPS
jgi:cell division protein FtsZ